jgi:hypothetical protein
MLLVAMMAITFTGQDLNVTGALARRDGVGNYDGKTISARDYSFYYNTCERQAQLYRQQFGDLLGPGQSIDSFFNVKDCVRRTLQQAYVIPTVAGRMGIGMSMATVQKKAEEEAIQQSQQQESLLEEDRMSARDIYERSLQNYPLDLRQREAVARQTGELLNETVPLSDASIRAHWLATETGIELRVIRYNQPQMLARIKKSIDVTEEQVRAAFAEEQAAQTSGDEKPKAFEDEQAFVQDRLKTKLAREQLDAANQELVQLKGQYRLEAVAKILGTPIENAGVVRLQELNQVPAGGGSRANLKTPGFLKELGKRRSNFVSGPHQDGEFTVYVEVGDVQLPGSAVVPAAARDEIKDRVGRDLTGQFYSFLLQEESLRGQFTVDLPTENTP